MAHQNWMTSEMEHCIRHCTDCAVACEKTIAHCLTMGGEHSSQPHIGLMMNCASICRTAAEFMISNSRFHTRTCGVCAEVCESCAADCERLANGDRTMLECARMCRECAETCHAMAGAMV